MQATTGISAPLRRKCLAVLACVACALIVLLLQHTALAQGDPANAALKIATDGELSTYWSPLHAGLIESFGSTKGYVEIRNNWNVALDRAVLYGEYFDAAGRFCFSLAFSQERNVPEKGPVKPGQTRVLYSVSQGLSPASIPAEVRLHLIQQGVQGQSQVISGNATIRAPAELGGSVRLDKSSVTLPPNLLVGNGALVNLLLAKLSLDKQGRALESTVLSSASDQITDWFRQFALEQNTFYPATINGMPTDSDTLVLVRAVLSDRDLRDMPAPPHLDPWIQNYTSKTRGDLPPVSQFILRRTTGQSPSVGALGSSPAVFEFHLLADWSEPAVEWERDPAMPHGLRRQLK